MQNFNVKVLAFILRIFYNNRKNISNRSRMRIGISTASYFTKVPTENCFAELKRIGVDVCEVFLSSMSEYDGSVADMIIANKTIEVDSIHALTNQFEPELFSLNPRAEADSLAVLDKVLTMGERLGAKHYTFHGATMLKKTGYSFDYDRLAKVVAGVAARAAAHGLTLNYENVHWTYCQTPDYFRNLAERVPELRATLDIKQALLSECGYSDFLDVMKERLDVVHVCDYDENRKLYLPGRGSFDFGQMFKRLIDIGFKGCVQIEVYPQAYNDMNELRQAYDYIMEIALRSGADINNGGTN